MSDVLRELEVLALDCQAGGATPAHGDLLELGWAVCARGGNAGPVRSHWIVPRTDRPIRRAVRDLTGWTEACVADAIQEREAWAELREDVKRTACEKAPPQAPTVIHYARFELRFLRDLHQRIGDSDPFPLDAICLHAVAARLFPDLPRRNIRALAGYLGHSPDLVRRSAGHVAATAFIWHALVPLLEEAGLFKWDDLKAWLDATSLPSRPKRRLYPLALERRRALPDRAGVYRFRRRNGDVLYVGKATSLKKRVASHFKSRGPATERVLELLTQVHEIHHTETASLLEAALLESDEIKRHDPPYNVQLRAGDRSAWFASRNLAEAVGIVDDAHRIGPLPSQRALSALAALIELAEGADPSPRLQAMALAVPTAFLPDAQLFREGWQGFVGDYLSGSEPRSARRVAAASRALWLERGRAELDASADDTAPDVWDLARVRRRLERAFVQTGLLVRRARFLCLLADADVAFRERDMDHARGLTISRAEIVDSHDLDNVTGITGLPARRPRTLRARQSSFDAAAYDRMRVLLTELRRVQDEGGDVALRIGTHTLVAERLAKLMRAV